MLLDVHDELIEERVQEDLFWHVFVLFKDGLEASQNHFCAHLIDLLVTRLAAVVLKKPTY